MSPSFASTCQTCQAPIRMMPTTQGWKACEPSLTLGYRSLPRRPAAVVTEAGELANVLVDQDRPQPVHGYPLHWQTCRGPA
jgi:hypothetical protein